MFTDIRDKHPRSEFPLSPAAKLRSPAERLIYWIDERERIRRKKEARAKRPWTDDPILREFKFCNVRREDDAVTKWIKMNWRDPHIDDPMMWHAMGVARLINWPPTLQAIGYPDPWLAERSRTRMAARRQRGEQVFTGAYMITNAGQKMNKVDTVIFMLDNLSKLKHHPEFGNSLQTAHELLTNSNHCGMGSFMAGQVVADCKHTYLLNDASDWWDWCAPGPGSQRGLSRLLDVKFRRFKNLEFVDHLRQLRKEIKGEIPVKLCLQDLQSCLCEFDKFERTLWGEGRPRSLYKPDKEKEF